MNNYLFRPNKDEGAALSRNEGDCTEEDERLVLLGVKLVAESK